MASLIFLRQVSIVVMTGVIFATILRYGESLTHEVKM